MAHKSKKKHLKHLHAQQRASAAAGTSSAKTAHAPDVEPDQERGIVSAIVHGAAEKIMDKERKIVKKVKSLLG